MLTITLQMRPIAFALRPVETTPGCLLIHIEDSPIRSDGAPVAQRYTYIGRYEDPVDTDGRVRIITMPDFMFKRSFMPARISPRRMVRHLLETGVRMGISDAAKIWLSEYISGQGPPDA